MSDTFINPIDIVQVPSTGTPPAGYHRIVAKADGNLYGKLGSTERQLDAVPIASTSELRIDGGSASTTFSQYLLRIDFGADGATADPIGSP